MATKAAQQLESPTRAVARLRNDWGRWVTSSPEDLAARGGNDAPVSVFSSPSEIQAWLDRLQDMRQTYAGDEEALRDIGRAEHEARTYLELRSASGVSDD